MVVSTPNERHTSSPAVTMAAAILDILASVSPAALGPSELGRRLGAAKSSVANVCGALTAAGLLRREGTSYVLGHRLAELGATYLEGIDEVKAFNAVCKERMPTRRETVQMATLGPGLEVTHVARWDGTFRNQLILDMGQRLPATCTATGKALLAALPPGELEQRLASGPLPRFTEHSITDAAALRADFDATRARGWAVDDEEVSDGVLCFGAVIPRRRRVPQYAVSFTLLKAWAPVERWDLLGQELVGLAAVIADWLGEGMRSASAAPLADDARVAY
jgi:IclR family transcriptional regulator, blcABC operon repressor